MTRDDLIAEVLTAHRARGPHGEIRTHRAWHDLDDAGRTEAFEETLRMRKQEAALAPDGLSTTARAILARIEGA